MTDPEPPPPSFQISDEAPSAPESAYDWSQPPQHATPSRPASSPAPAVGALIPTSNPCALFAYYSGVFSLIPCLGLILGPIAVVLGVLGLKAIDKAPGLPGKAHAWVGIVLGGLVLLGHLVLIAVILANRPPS